MNTSPTPPPQSQPELERPSGHCEDDAAWQEFSTDPRYANPTREGLAMGHLSDFYFANAQFLIGRNDPMLVAYQTAAKERIRWLSVQLAAALSRLPADKGEGPEWPALPKPYAWVDQKGTMQHANGSDRIPPMDGWEPVYWAADVKAFLAECRNAALRSRLAACGQGWQPIESAPRDSERILLWDGKWVSPGGYCEYDSIGWLMDCYDTERPTPTHWQPLPEPPK